MFSRGIFKRLFRKFRAPPSPFPRGGLGEEKEEERENNTRVSECGNIWGKKRETWWI
jgi:hypothetical protein